MPELEKAVRYGLNVQKYVTESMYMQKVTDLLGNLITTVAIAGIRRN